MNAKQTFMALGFSAMTVGLIALPGSSARQPEPQEQGSPEVRKQIVLDNPQYAKTVMSRDGDDDFQVFVTSGGGWLGAGISEVSADKVKELKLQAERGVVLGKIVPDSPAAKAGLKESDVITEINGQHVEGTEQFRRMIHEIPSGRSVQFTVWRNGQSQTVNVTSGKADYVEIRSCHRPRRGILRSKYPMDQTQLKCSRRPGGCQERIWELTQRIWTANSAIISAPRMEKEFWFAAYFPKLRLQKRG